MSIGIAYVRKNEWNNPMTLTPAQLRVGNNVGKGVKTQPFSRHFVPNKNILNMSYNLLIS